MWPSEGAVSQEVIPLFARHGVQWIATDSRVLARSGPSGYRVDDPDVLCQPYRAQEAAYGIAVFFREGWLADDIGFRYHRYADYDQAARELLTHLEWQYARRISGSGDRVMTIALDGENAWGAYRDDARQFLHALYRALEASVEIETVTFAEYLAGNPARGLVPHSPEGLAPVAPLYPGSWADEAGSAPGVDFGTWIGEPEENAAWALLGEVRSHLAASGATPDTNPEAFHAMYAAEGSDWLSWLGTDQESARDIELDALFHGHLERVYDALAEAAPPHITPHARPPTVVWSPTARPSSLAPEERLLVRADRPGTLWYAVDGSSFIRAPLVCVRGSEDAVPRYQRLLGPFPPGVREVRFRVELGTAPQDVGPAPESEAEHIVRIADPGTALPARGDEPTRH
jgi:alpha-amylase/alpha-mannosidase (GH57 family)